MSEDTSDTVSTAADASRSSFIELPAPGYDIGELIGRGGMGEVVAATDRRIGRGVAIKRMRSASRSPEALSRFMREARIQARLDHPAIVPVYELGMDDQGLPYFTMKRLAGETLASKLAAGAPIQPLLRAFADVCLAIELAHSRGVVHRDLKPSNVMLGDFGEVYVLDWGIARDLGAEDPLGPDTPSQGETREGSVLGTPGYMSPEQLRDPSAVRPASDVYALGAILFEILAGEPLHPRGEAALATTLFAEATSPAGRRPDRAIAPELDATCIAAIAPAAAQRPSARELGERVQRYLDGDRDLEYRKTRARELVATARGDLASGDLSRRASAVHASGRALALDPDSVEAAELVTSLIVEPPAVLPPAVVDALARSESAMARVRGRQAMKALGLLASLGVFIPLLVLDHWAPLLAIYGAIAANVLLGWRTYRAGRIYTPAVVVGSIALAISISRLAGPYLLVPPFVCGALMSVAAIPWIRERPWAVVAYVVVAAMSPIALELAGVFRASSSVEHGALVMRSMVFDITGTIDLVALGFANLGFLIVIGVFMRSLIHARRVAERTLEIQGWHLRQLVPDLS